MLLESVKDSANETTSYKYDSLNRLTKVKDALGTIEYVYDANGNITEVTETESIFEDIIGAGKTIRREYDSLNRVLKYTDYNGREVSYGYDTLGNLIALTYPGGEIVRYEYNPDGLVKSMTSQSGGTEYTWGYEYDSYGRLTKISRPDGTVETRSYDVAGQLTEQVDKDAEGNIFQKNTYTYNVFGEVIQKTTSNAGDVSSLETVSMTYDDANRLVTYNEQAVTYDAKGNMTYGPVDGKMQALTYDCRNRLIEAGGVTYTYDAENTRIATTENGRTTEYVTDTGGSLSKLLTAYEADGTETNYYYGAEGLSGQYNDGTKKGLFYHYDNIGSTTCITNLTGTVVERFAYGTYGELLTTVKNQIRFLYNGAYGVATDSNGLYYMRARYYNPDIKRFINQDIKVGDIGSGQSLNRYAYCEGNPVSLIDPFGLSPKAPDNLFSAVAHFTLGWLGNINGIGIIFDIADVGLSVLEGDPIGASISFACAIPAAGIPAGVARGAKRTAQLGEYIMNMIKNSDNLSRFAGKIAEIAESARTLLRNNLPEEFAPFFLKGDDAAELLKKSDDVIDQATDVAKHHGEEIYTSARNVDNVQTDFYGRPKGVEKSLDEYDSFGDKSSVTKPNHGQGFSPNGYNPKPGERTFEGYVNNNVPRDVETKLYTQSNGFNTNPKNDGHFKRFGTEPNQHGIAGAHVHQPTRNVNPNNGMITGKPGSKTRNGGVTVPGAKDVKQLYDYLNNQKYH